MFGLFNKNKSGQPPTSASAKIKNDVRTGADIHVMPERFLPATAGGKANAGLIKWVIVGMVVLILFVAGAIFFSVDWSKTGQKPAVNLANKNVNEKVNLNANINQNSNINQNLNQNQNTNSLVNENINLNTNINSNTNIAPVVKPKLIAAPDTDRDGLTDVEEEVLGADKNKPDTDADGYLDGSEVVKLFDPAQGSSKKLAESKLIATFTNNVYKYTLLYPIAFEVAVLDATEKESGIKAKTGETVDITVEDNPNILSIGQWYKGFTGLDAVTAVKATGNGYKYVESSDGLKIYLGANNRVFVFSYLLGSVAELNYKLIFQLMVESFKLF